ncbi:hypothetical protein D3C87_1672300 [compost metagenome]
MRHRGLGRLRQVDRHAISALDAVALQAVRQPVGLRLDLVKGVARLRAVALFVDQRQAATAVGPFIAGVDADVVGRRHLPLELGHELRIGFGSGQHGLSLMLLCLGNPGPLNSALQRHGCATPGSPGRLATNLTLAQ